MSEAGRADLDGHVVSKSVCQPEAEEPAVEFRRLCRTALSRVVEIDRRERINVLYDQHGTQLVARHGNWSASAWDPDGQGEHSVEAKVHELRGAVAVMSGTPWERLQR
jgi:hypothetical protein